MRRMATALVCFVVWFCITVFGAQIILGGEQGELNDLVSHGIGWQFLAAAAFAIGAIVAFGWRDIRFGAPQQIARVMWFPALFLLLFVGLIAILGLPPGKVAVFVVVNTFLVGLSEELALRGIVFHGLLSRMSGRAAIILTTVIFGAMHSVNVFITGDLSGALVQSTTAAASGLALIAIYTRTGSIWAAIVFHWLWDCATFLVTSAPRSSTPVASEPALSGIWVQLIPLAIVVPMLIFGVIMLRRILFHGGPLIWGSDFNPNASASSES